MGLNLFILFGILFSCNSFTALVTYRATCFASGLAGTSTFAATRNLFFGRGGYSLNHLENLL